MYNFIYNIEYIMVDINTDNPIVLANVLLCVINKFSANNKDPNKLKYINSVLYVINPKHRPMRK